MAMASTSSTTARMLRRAAFSAQSRGYASAASTSTSASASTSSNPATSTSEPPSRARSKINVSLILSRQPILLREPTELESTVHTYNHALQRRLQQPFARDFYFRPGSAGANAFEADEAARRRDIDGGDAAGAAATVKGKRGGGKDAAAAAAPTTTTTSRVESGPAALPRKTKADEENDTLSLERALDRTLFLVYKDAQTGQWRFPTRNVDYQNSETLHRVAPHSVTKTLGEDLDIWLVTNMPVGLLPRPGVEDVVVDEKTYFLRGHILSGSPSRTPLDKDVVSEYAWLTSEEIAERLRGGNGADACKTYHEGIVDLLSA